MVEQVELVTGRSLTGRTLLSSFSSSMPALLTEKIHLSFIEEGGGGGRIESSSIIYHLFSACWWGGGGIQSYFEQN